jgi:hypothetical protein
LSLVEILKDRDRLVEISNDGARMVDAEIASKRGIRAAALKAGYKSVKAIKPGIIADALRHLMPEFAPVIEPYYQAGKASGNVERHFRENARQIADSMLSVTDARARRAENRVMKRVYNALRGQALKHTMEAVPRLASLIERHDR